MNIVSYNPGHDGAVAHLRDGRLVSSIEAEKDSNWRYTPLSSRDLLDAFGRLEQVPDVLCTGGWWPREARPTGPTSHVGYRGIDAAQITVSERRLLREDDPVLLVLTREVAPAVRVWHVAVPAGLALLRADLGGSDRRVL